MICKIWITEQIYMNLVFLSGGQQPRQVTFDMGFVRHRNCLPFHRTWFHPRFLVGCVHVTRSLVLYVCFIDRCLSFFFWPLCCLFFDFLILVTPMVSSNSSYIIHNFLFMSCSGLVKHKPKGYTSFPESRYTKSALDWACIHSRISF